MYMSTFFLWAVWLFIGLIGFVSLGFADTTVDLMPLRITLGIITIIYSVTIPWYRSGLNEVNSRACQTNEIGIVETTILPNGSKISTVRTDHDVINVSDRFHIVLPVGVMYSQLVQTNDVACGLQYSTETSYIWYCK